MATIAAAVIGAAGAIGSSVAASQAQKKAAAAGRGRPTNVPLPKYADALDRYTARLIAENATAVPPSFGDYLRSGGTETFPLKDPGFSPGEAVHLGIVDSRTGKSVPFTSGPGEHLTPEQALYLGQQRLRQTKGSARGPFAQYARYTYRLNSEEDRPQTPKRQAHEADLQKRKTRLERFWED